MSTLPTIPDEQTYSLYKRSDEIIKQSKAVHKKMARQTIALQNLFKRCSEADIRSALESGGGLITQPKRS